MATDPIYNIQQVPIDQVCANPLNPRIITGERFEALVKSIREAPWMLKLRPIVVNKYGIVLGGNQRFRACVAAGMMHVWVIIADELEDEQARRFVLRDNVDFGKWDLEILKRDYGLDEMERLGLQIDLLSASSLVGDPAIRPPPLMGTDDAVEPNISDEELEESQKNFNENTIKQIVIKLPNDLYEDALKKMDDISKELDLDDNSEVLLHLISFYERSNDLVQEDE